MYCSLPLLVADEDVLDTVHTEMVCGFGFCTRNMVSVAVVFISMAMILTAERVGG